MPEKPIVPPTRKPVSTFPTPTPAVAFYTELVNRDDPAYYANTPVKRGSLYSSMVGAKRDVIDQYPLLYFLRERQAGTSDQQVFWDWSTDAHAENSYNAQVQYVSNSITFPAFTRVSTIRRDVYDASPTLPIGYPLTALIGVSIESSGSGYTKARGVIDGTDVDIEFVCAGGELISAVIKNEGEGVTPQSIIQIIGDGVDGVAVPIVQSISCVLTTQQKQELDGNDPQKNEFVRVIRTYETLPGPWIYTTRFDVDGALITAKTRRQVTDFITDSDEIIPSATGADWVQTFHKETDDFISEETVESRKVPGNLIFDTKIADDGKIITTDKILIDVSTAVNDETLVAGVWTKRFLQQVDDSTLIKVHQASNKVSWQMFESRDIPGNPMETTRIDNDGVVIHVTTILSEASTIVDGETLVGGVWTKITAEAVSDLVAKKIVETRTIPGNPMPTSRIDEDSVPVSIITTYKDKNLVTTSEAIVAGVWTKTKKEHCSSDMGVSDLVVDEVVESRTLPGLPMVGIKIDKDGKPLDVIRTLKDTLAVSPSEIISGGGVWIKTEKDAVSDLVCWEVVTARDAQGNNVFSSGIDGDLEVENITTVQRNQSAITQSSSESGGFITTVEKKAITDLIADQVTTVTKWLDKASYSISIINLIPREFMAFIPTVTESHILAGIASMPALAVGEFEHSQRQLNKVLYEDRITSLGPISLPITHTNKELTELYGGGVLNVTLTLDTTGSQTIDQGYLITRSTLTVLGNGMDVKETAQLDGTEWPTNPGTAFDQDMQIEYPFEEQIVPVTYVVTTGAFILETLDPIDLWRSQRKKVTKTPINTDSSTAIVTVKYSPFQFPGLLTTALAGYYVRSSSSQLCRHTIRTWWENSAGTPVISVDEIIMDDIIISQLNDNTALAYSGQVLHDDITTFGVLFWPATTPSYSDYIATWDNNDKIIAASVDKTDIPNLWKIQTITVTMR